MIDFFPFTFEEDDQVGLAVLLWTLHSSIQMVGNPREDFLDVLRIAWLQGMVVVAEHFGVL